MGGGGHKRLELGHGSNGLSAARFINHMRKQKV